MNSLSLLVLIIGLNFKSQFCSYSDSHDLLMMSPNINNIATTALKGDNYRCII